MRQGGCAGANAMAISLAQGRRVELAKVDNFADGVAVKQVPSSSSGPSPFRALNLFLKPYSLVKKKKKGGWGLGGQIPVVDRMYHLDSQVSACGYSKCLMTSN